MPTVAVIQARMSSSRLPGKVLRDLDGRPTLGWVVRAARDAGVFDDVVVATSDEPSDDAVAQWCSDQSLPCHRGPLDDVLSRFVQATSQLADDDVIARLTGDCPLLDPEVIRMAVTAFAAGDVDYLSTVEPRTLPRGLDVEVLSVAALRRADAAASGADRTHVTSWLYREPGRCRQAAISFPPGAGDLRLTLDTQEDADVLDAVVAALGDGPHPWSRLVTWLRDHPDVAAGNAHVRQKTLDEG